MLIKCRKCKREFDKPSQRNQHERDAHNYVSQSAKKWAAQNKTKNHLGHEAVDLAGSADAHCRGIRAEEK